MEFGAASALHETQEQAILLILVVVADLGRAVSLTLTDSRLSCSATFVAEDIRVAVQRKCFVAVELIRVY